jgi:hypothetical protein
LEQQFVFPLRTSMVFSNSVFADHSRGCIMLHQGFSVLPPHV